MSMLASLLVLKPLFNSKPARKRTFDAAGDQLDPLLCQLGQGCQLQLAASTRHSRQICAFA